MDRLTRPACGLLAGWLLCAAASPAAAAPEPPAAGPAAAAPAPRSGSALLAGSIEQLWERGERAFEQGDLAAAQEAFSEALSRDERRARSWNYLGGVHFARGDLPRALEEFRRALELDPLDARAANNLGTALERTGDFAEAERQYLQATQVAPAYPVTWRNLGILYARGLGRPDAARAAWQRYLELAPAGAEAEEVRRELEALERSPAEPPAR